MVIFKNQMIEKESNQKTILNEAFLSFSGMSLGSVFRYISFDKGAYWSQIAAPQRDSLGKMITDCDGLRDCYLHLHGMASFSVGSPFVPVYSVDSAVGIVMATGNVGDRLRKEEEHKNALGSKGPTMHNTQRTAASYSIVNTDYKYQGGQRPAGFVFIYYGEAQRKTARPPLA